MIKDLVMVEWIDPETGSKVLSLGWLSHDGPDFKKVVSHRYADGKDFLPSILIPSHAVLQMLKATPSR